MSHAEGEPDQWEANLLDDPSALDNVRAPIATLAQW